MRKLYALLAGLFFALTAINARSVVPDVANFTFTVDHASKNVAFTNTSVLGSEPGLRRALWTFGDGTTLLTPPLQSTQHHYQLPGTYTVCLKIYRYRPNANDSILTAQVCKTVVIHTVCKADFERLPVTTSPNGLHAAFKALPWHNGEKKPVRICWTFGDGRDTCIQYSNTFPGPYIVNHNYTQPGVYQVCVNILYQGGCEASKCKPVLMGRPDTCKADFERLPVAVSANPLIVVYKALPTHNNNKKPQRICWDFGDGKDTCINYTNSYTGPYTVAHRYLHPALYEVCVKILYYGGCDAGKCKPVQVGRPDTCKADFVRLPITPNNNPLFAAFKALPEHNNNRKPSKVCWNFGDGRDTCINYPESYSGLYLVGHRYNEPGNYLVCVKINYYGGCEAYKCERVQIGRPDSCKADFERIPVTAATPHVVGFKALPWHNNEKKPQKICWRFGDGSDTCINYPASYTGLYTVAHRYLQPGTYEVCVKIIYYGGCEAYKCKPIVVPPPNQTCRVNLFEITPSITSLVRGFFAIPHSDPNRRPVRACWDFGDGTDTCIVLNPQQPLLPFLIRHTYPAPGVYRACVKVLFEGGCIAADCKEVVIRPASNVCGGFMLDSLIAPRTYKFKAFAIHNPNDEVIGYRWTFGDGSNAIGREVTHTYSQGGDYEVCLMIKTRLGCETKICKTVWVPGNNQPALTLSPNPVHTVLTAAFLSTHTETVNIKIVNGNGIPVRTYVRNANVGSNTWTFDLTTLVPGVYSFVVQSPHQLASAVFIKI
ncbi:MAG: PKD domain-containing protein [Chitinophagaceae bacterium]